jgi:hypothetical protein
MLEIIKFCFKDNTTATATACILVIILWGIAEIVKAFKGTE